MIADHGPERLRGVMYVQVGLMGAATCQNDQKAGMQVSRGRAHRAGPRVTDWQRRREMMSKVQMATSGHRWVVQLRCMHMHMSGACQEP